MDKIFNYLNSNNKYSTELLKCISETVENLLRGAEDPLSPGILLGKIQSGKTRTFIGVIGNAFDRGYDYCIILTKNSKTLAQQTYNRLEKEFNGPIDDTSVRLYDIMRMPPDITEYDINKKLIFVVKKQTKNLDRLINFFDTYPLTGSKRVLIVDDEADYASIGFKKNNLNKDEFNLRTIAEKIGTVRGIRKTDFLQVTATPYSLYLQPDADTMIRSEYLPTRPAFTQIVPLHDKYVGGRVYFEGRDEKTDKEVLPAKYLHVEIGEKEIQILGKPDRRYIENILETVNLQFFRRSIITFLVSGAIRSLQESNKNYKSSFIIHTETGKPKHLWQKQLIESLKMKLKEAYQSNPGIVRKEILDSIDLLKVSVIESGFLMPDDEQIINRIGKALLEEHIVIRSINSDTDILNLLDKKGQLQLDHPYNIFVGGQILDRGVTIDNLLGFFYGRNPKSFQQDTVLQHSRMYGTRSLQDLSVTRLYTTARIYDVMRRMHESDTGLIESFKRGHGKNGVVFIYKDPAGVIKPCSPTKILMSKTTTLGPHKRFLPIGFQTQSKSELTKLIPEIDRMFYDNSVCVDIENGIYRIDIQTCKNILSLIDTTFLYEKRFNNSCHKSNVKTLVDIVETTSFNPSADKYEEVYCIIRTGRNISRYRSDGITFSDAPDAGETDLNPAKDLAKKTPCLLLIRQNGREDLGWRGHPFWWPVLVTPADTKTAIFTDPN